MKLIDMIVSRLKQDVLCGSVCFLVSDVNDGDYCRAEWADRERDVSRITNTALLQSHIKDRGEIQATDKTRRQIVELHMVLCREISNQFRRDDDISVKLATTAR